MNIFNATSAVSNLFTQKSGKVMPPAEVKANESAKYEPTVEELSKKIDPDNMSRNEMRELSDALWREGESDLSRELFSHSAVLVRDGNSYRNAGASDPIMQQKHNMGETIESNIEFRQSKGQSIDGQIDLLAFLEKFQDMKNAPTKIDIHV